MKFFFALCCFLTTALLTPAIFAGEWFTDFEKAKTMLNGALAKYLSDETLASDLSQALKIAINSVYGLTSAGFDNPFRDIRNVDNIVAKRGALFMINLKIIGLLICYNDRKVIWDIEI